MKAARFAVPIASLLVACHSSPLSVSSKVPPSGGVVKLDDGTSVSIPDGALTQPTTIQVGGEPNPVTLNDVVQVGPVYRFGPEGTQFAQPVTVTIFYDASKLTSGDSAADITILTAPVGSSDFVALPTAIADGSHVSTTTTHFSDFVATVRKHPHQDLSAALSDAAVGDMATAAGDQGSPADAGDQSNADLLQNPDLLCAHVWNPSTCTLTSSCNNVSYSLNCQMTTCWCSANPNSNNNRSCPKPSPFTNTTTCPSPEPYVEGIWTMCCYYP
jgi:hypothetical protein